MNALAIYSDQGKTRATSGGSSSRSGVGKPAPIAGRYQFQSSKGPGRFLLPRLRQLGRGSRPGRFLYVGWSGSLDEVAHFRRLRAAGLRSEQVAAIIGGGQ